MKAEERARTQEKANKEALASPERFDQKKLCRDGNFLRKVEKTAHKQLGIKHRHFDEAAHINATVKKHGRDSLPDNFNNEMCTFMKWKTDEKGKWITPEGFHHHAGVPGSHVVKIRHPGAGRTELHRSGVN